jgi:hypothetical protein
MSEINKMDAVMFFVDFPFLKNDPLKLNIVEKPNINICKYTACMINTISGQVTNK